MYILGLSSSWGTSRIRPAWSPFEHQLTPALSPIRGPCPKPRRLEEVVYSPNDSCSHFTQRLFPPKLPQQHTCTIFSTHLPSFILIIHHIQASIYILLLQDKSFYHFFGSSWQADCSRSLVSDKLMHASLVHLACLSLEKSVIQYTHPTLSTPLSRPPPPHPLPNYISPIHNHTHKIFFFLSSWSCERAEFVENTLELCQLHKEISPRQVIIDCKESFHSLNFSKYSK